MDEPAQTRIFGIRHHGPGCARSLLAALAAWEPDCLLVEGPPEGESLLSFVLDADMIPPVALLIHTEPGEGETPRAAFYPFAEFSPEWQTLRYGLGRNIPVRFMDLPVAARFALDRAADQSRDQLSAQPPDQTAEPMPDCSPDQGSDDGSDQGADRTDRTDLAAKDGERAPASPNEPNEPDGPFGKDEPDAEDGDAEDRPGFDYADPLDWLGRAAGYENGESWWNHMVEERADGLELFEAIREAMTDLRASVCEEGPGRSPAAEREEALREAHMRKCLRQARKEGFGRIAVVCGAWHVPALEAMPPAKTDNDLLKSLRGLPKVKVSAAWAPWTYANLSRSGGYGAGVVSPAWYEHLWRARSAESRTIGWLAEAARLFREEDIDCSPAHVIEAARLADALAAMRDRPQPGLEELQESLRTVACMGESLPLHLIGRRLVIGEKMGRVPEGVPAIPLQRDIERQQKKLRLKPEASQKTLDLDLRAPTDLDRSRLLHRLLLLEVGWGVPAGEGRGKGTFHELWTLQWEPRLAVDIINAGRWGNTVAEAAGARALDLAARADLPELARLVDRVLLADLPPVVPGLIRRLEDLAARVTDTAQLLATLPELVRVARYGDVRGTDAGMVLAVLRGLIPRAAIGLPPACSGLDEESSAALHEPIRQAHAAVRLVGGDDLVEIWRQALRRIMLAEDATRAGLRGLATRLLFDDQVISARDAAARMSLSLSSAVPPAEAAAWLDAFLGRSALVLLHDDALWGLADAWLKGLSADHFITVLPMLRRTFTAFSAPERRRLAERARRPSAGSSGAGAASPDGTGSGMGAAAWDEERAALPVPFLQRVLGLA